jgi:hypothetical protein
MSVEVSHLRLHHGPSSPLQEQTFLWFGQRILEIRQFYVTTVADHDRHPLPPPSILTIYFHDLFVTIDGVWIDEYIYWPFTGRNYK